MLRKKKSTFDESDLPSDGWIWGNSRGGGGAPLKDMHGNDVANLKKVLNGVVEVDHSPSPKGKGLRPQPNFQNNDYDEGDGYGNGNNNNNNRKNSQKSNGNKGSHKQLQQNNYNEDQYDEPPPNRRASGGRQQPQLNAIKPNYSNNSNSNNNGGGGGGGGGKTFNKYSDEARNDQPRAIPGLTNLPVYDEHSGDTHGYNSSRNMQHVGGVDYLKANNNGQPPSPKKFMSAIQEMNAGGSSIERDAKHR